MTERAKFVTISRVIGPKSGFDTITHYLDTIDENGVHWMAEMTHGIEPWLVYTKVWYKDPQQPYD